MVRDREALRLWIRSPYIVPQIDSNELGRTDKVYFSTFCWVNGGRKLLILAQVDPFGGRKEAAKIMSLLFSWLFFVRTSLKLPPRHTHSLFLSDCSFLATP